MHNAHKTVPAVMFPSDTFLDILMENEIMRGKMTAKKAQETNLAEFREKMKQHFMHALGNAIIAVESGGHDSMRLSRNGKLTMTPFVTCFLKAFHVHSVFEDRFIEQLYQELRPIALHENKARGSRFVLALHNGCMTALCPFALAEHADLQAAA